MRKIVVELWYQSIDYPVSGAVESTGWLAVRGVKGKKLGIHLAEWGGKLYFCKSIGKAATKKDFRMPLYRLYGEVLRMKKRFTLEYDDKGLILNQNLLKQFETDQDCEASYRIMDTQRKLFLNGY